MGSTGGPADPSFAETERRDIRVILGAQTETGAILACPTYRTYRYAWLRDGAFCAVALDRAGEVEAAARFHAWVAARVLDQEPAMRRAVEAVASGRDPDPADHLPCRFMSDGLVPGDDGWGTFQMDGPSLWLWALETHARSATAAPRLAPTVQRAVAVTAEYVAALWARPSFDAWEEHGDRLSTSTLAACLAGLLAAHRLGIEPLVASDAVAGIRAEIAARGRRVGHLPRSDLDTAIDAGILWCGPLLRAIHSDDEAWRATLEGVEADLEGPDGGVHRYAADTFYGGGEWPVLSAALGLALLDRGRPGDLDRARRCAEWIERQRAADGQLPEQISDHLLHPSALEGWQARWGPVARPLSWSHAMAMLLRRALQEASGQPGRPTASWAA